MKNMSILSQLIAHLIMLGSKTKTFPLHRPAKIFPENKLSIFTQLVSSWIRIWKSFFPITFRFSKKLWQRSKNQQNRLFLDCVYAEVNQQIQYFAYVKCFLRNMFHPYVQFQAYDTFLSKKKTSKKFYYQVKGCI